jgi:hypothetical protein
MNGTGALFREKGHVIMMAQYHGFFGLSLGGVVGRMEVTLLYASGLTISISYMA